MSFRTVEVDLEDGRVHPRGEEPLPSKARALLTILELSGNGSETQPGSGGLQRFLTAADFPLTPEQFKAAMESDPLEQ